MTALDSAEEGCKAARAVPEDALGVFPFFALSAMHEKSTQFLSKR